MSIEVLIVDDEENAREGLAMMMMDHPHFKVVAMASDGIEALEMIRKLNPQLVLLDVQMPKVNGLEVANNLQEPRPEIIFATAHDDFAIKAFDLNAIDYLLKPFTADRLQKALEKARARIGKRTTGPTDSIDHLLQKSDFWKNNQSAMKGNENELVIKVDQQILFLPWLDITHLEAYDYYTKIHTTDRFHLLRTPLKRIVDSLPDYFIKTHRSYVVNKNHVKRVKLSGSGEAIIYLSSDLEAKVSRSLRKEALEVLSRKD